MKVQWKKRVKEEEEDKKNKENRKNKERVVWSLERSESFGVLVRE